MYRKRVFQTRNIFDTKVQFFLNRKKFYLNFKYLNSWTNFKAKRLSERDVSPSMPGYTNLVDL